MSITSKDEEFVSILVVEDDPEDAMLLINSLKKFGFSSSKVDSVTNLNSAFSLLEKKKIDVVLLDLHLDDSSGIETFELFQAHSPNLPVVVLSGSDELSIPRRAVHMGAQDFVCKSEVNRTDLSKTIAYAIERSKLLQKAREDSEFKSNFLAQMSHEIRTPMNGVIGLTEILKSASNLTAEQVDIVNTLASCGKHLISLISDILDISKIESGKLAIDAKKFNVRELVDTALNIFSGSAAQKNLTVYDIVDPSVPSFAVSSPGRIGQVLSNLVGNAIKYTNSGFVSVSVSFTPTVSSKGIFKFEVTDSGLGVSPEVAEKLFRPYEQAPSSVIDHEGIRGTGLGLAICKGIVNHLGGSIGVDSEIGKGSTFWFCIELEKIEELNARANLAGKRILVISECEIRRKALAAQLVLRNLKVSTANSLSDALASFRLPDFSDNGIDLAIIDNYQEEWHESVASFANEISQKIPLILVQGAGNGDAAMRNVGSLTGTLSQSRVYSKIAGFFNDKTAPSQEVRAPSAKAMLGLKVLIAEDNAVNVKVTARLLDMLGCKWAVANDGVEAINTLQTEDFDVILMDCRMPNMDGLAATRVIRSWKTKNASVPIIALTANAFDEDREACRQAGMDDFISKPLTLDELRGRLETYAKQPSSTSTASSSSSLSHSSLPITRMEN